MRVTRKGKNKRLKKFCIYIWQEKGEKGVVTTYTDYIGDEELYETLRKDFLKQEYDKLF